MPNAVEPPVESPRDLASAYDLLSDGDGGEWRPIAGGTDLMVQITGEMGDPPERLIDIWALDELRGISLVGEALVLGALTTYTEIRRSPVVAEFLPALAECAATIGAAQIQNRGTIGGNVVNASPAGDTLPILLATDANFVLGWAGGTRTVAVLERALPTRETAALAAGVLADELAPIDDVRSTADYRRAVAARVLHRLIRDEGSW